MNKESVDQIILGDNQFFGVNHLSETRGRETAEQFKDPTEIRRLLHLALDFGVESVFLSTHPDVGQITNLLRSDPVLRDRMSVYVNVPYIVKYISMVNTLGIPGTVRHVLRGATWTENVRRIFSTAGRLAMLDFIGLATQLVDVEMAPFRGLRVKGIFLHNTLCDLCLGYGMERVIAGFDRHIRRVYGVLPGYGTLNLPAFVRLLDRAGVPDGLLMAAVNKMGFTMNPDRSAYETEIARCRHSVLAMSTLASGRIKPDEAYAYLAGIGVRHLIVGLSSEKHAHETFGAIHHHFHKFPDTTGKKVD